jgi:hypothetical protein
VIAPALTLLVATALVALGAWAALGGAVLAAVGVDAIGAPLNRNAVLCRVAGAAGSLAGVALFATGVWIGA